MQFSSTKEGAKSSLPPQFHHENLCVIDEINRTLLNESSLFKFIGRARAKMDLEARVNVRARYYGLVYDLNGNMTPLGSNPL